MHVVIIAVLIVKVDNIVTGIMLVAVILVVIDYRNRRGDHLDERIVQFVPVLPLFFLFQRYIYFVSNLIVEALFVWP